jgi:hypothetical protein
MSGPTPRSYAHLSRRLALVASDDGQTDTMTHSGGGHVIVSSSFDYVGGFLAGMRCTYGKGVLRVYDRSIHRRQRVEMHVTVSDGEKRRQERAQSNRARQGRLFVPRRHAREGEQRDHGAGDGNSRPGLEGIAGDKSVVSGVEEGDVVGRVSR